MNIPKTFLKVGAVGVALAIEYDRTGVFTFLVPAVIGIFILISSWVSIQLHGIRWSIMSDAMRYLISVLISIGNRPKFALGAVVHKLHRQDFDDLRVD